MNKHARLGPSNTRWPHCPGSIREEAEYPDVSGAAAIDGTGSHLLLEGCLIHNVEAARYEGQVIGANHPDCINGWMIDRDRIERVQTCLAYIERRVRELGSQGFTVQVHSESKSNPGEAYGRDDWWGTADVTIIATDANNNTTFVEIVDYKDGRMWVDQNQNTQLISYMFGKTYNTPIQASMRCQKICRTTIVQPKTSTPIRYAEYTVDEIKEYADTLSVAAAATDNPDAILIPDDKGGKGYCRWCKHKPNCSAQLDVDLKTLTTVSAVNSDDQSLFERISVMGSNIGSLSNSELSELADVRSSLTAMFDAVDKLITQRIGEGQLVPGYEMQPGNSSKAFNISEDELVIKLKAKRMKKGDIYPSKLITPAQLIKCKALTPTQQKDVLKYIKEVPGKLTLKKVRREQQTVEEMFPVVEPTGMVVKSEIVGTENTVSFM